MVSGKEFRESLRRPLPGAKSGPKPRVVPAFTIQSMQRGTIVRPPPVCGVTIPKPFKPSEFRKYYNRGDFPISRESEGGGNKIAWKVSKL